MASFDGNTFEEAGSGGYSVPGFDAPYLFVVKKLAGSDDNVIQKIGADVQRLAMPVRCTAAELSALQGARGDTGTLDWSGGSDSVFLANVGTPVEVRPGEDVYFVTLSFMKT